MFVAKLPPLNIEFADVRRYPSLIHHFYLRYAAIIAKTPKPTTKEAVEVILGGAGSSPSGSVSSTVMNSKMRAEINAIKKHLGQPEHPGQSGLPKNLAA